MVVRYGFLPGRSILTGMGPIFVKQPKAKEKIHNISMAPAKEQALVA
jgi:hypothetical protein